MEAVTVNDPSSASNAYLLCIVLVQSCCCSRPATKSIESVKESLMAQFPDASDVQIIEFKHDQDDGLTKPWLPTPSCASGLRALARERRAKHKDQKYKLVFVCHGLGGILFKEAMRSEATSDESELCNSGVVFLGVPHEAGRPEETGDACCRMAEMSAKEGDWSSDDREDVGRQVHSICTGFKNCAAKLRVVSVTGGIPSRKGPFDLKVKEPLGKIFEKLEKLLPNGLSKASSPSHGQSDMADTRPPTLLYSPQPNVPSRETMFTTLLECDKTVHVSVKQHSELLDDPDLGEYIRRVLG